jgi:parallel beta-helix repeat protein
MRHSKTNLLSLLSIASILSIQAVRSQEPKPVTRSRVLVPSYAASGTEAKERTQTDADIQKLVDAGRGSIRFDAGTYRFKKTVTIDLSKTGFSAISGDGTVRIIMEGAGPAFHFIGHHDGTAAPDTVKPHVWEKERSPMVDGIEIVGAHAEADGIKTTGTMQLTLSRVVVRECRHAVHVADRNRNILISACHFYNNKGIGIFLDAVNLHQINVIGSHISYNKGGGIVSRGGNVRNLHIGTCDIEGNHDTAEGAAPAANVLLDSTGGSIGEVAVTGCTIQHTSKAAGSANIRILGAGDDSSLERRVGRSHTREGNVTIGDNVFSDVQVNIEITQARGVTITGNTFWEGFEHDLLVKDSEHIVVTGNNFDRNPRYLVNGFDNAERNGLVFQNCADSAITGNVIAGVWKKRAAVDISGCNRMNIANNTILDSDGTGLLLENVTRSLVSNNLIHDDREEGKRSKEPSFKATGGSDNVIGSNLLGNGK